MGIWASSKGDPSSAEWTPTMLKSSVLKWNDWSGNKIEYQTIKTIMCCKLILLNKPSPVHGGAWHQLKYGKSFLCHNISTNVAPESTVIATCVPPGNQEPEVLLYYRSPQLSFQQAQAKSLLMELHINIRRRQEIFLNLLTVLEGRISPSPSAALRTSQQLG